MACSSFGCTVKPGGGFDERVADVLELVGRDGRLGRPSGCAWSVACAVGGSRPEWPSASVPTSVGSLASSAGLLERRLGLDEDPLELLLVVAQRGLGVLLR